jgi:hypothetical protein
LSTVDVHCYSKDIVHLAAAQKSAIIQIIGKLIDIIGSERVCSVPTNWIGVIGVFQLDLEHSLACLLVESEIPA